MDDRTLLRAYLLDHDVAAFALIVARYGPMVLATANRQTGDAHLSQDVAQAVFIVLAKRAEAVHASGRSLGGWLHRTTILAARNANRIAARRARHERKATMHKNAVTADSRPIDRALLTELDGAIDSLGGHAREIVALRFIESLEIHEIAERLNLNVDTARKRLARAIQQLQHRMKGIATSESVSSALLSIATPSIPGVPFSTTDIPTAASQQIAKGTQTMIRKTFLTELAGVTLLGSLVVGGMMSLTLAQSTTPPEPAAQSKATETPVVAAVPFDAGLRAAWDDLEKDEPYASAALLKLSDHPSSAIALLKQQLAPVALSLEELDTLLDALESDDESVWKPAFERMQYADPRLALGLESLMERVQEQNARSRLVGVMSNFPLEFTLNGEIWLRGLGGDGGHNFVLESPDDVNGNLSGSIWAEAKVANLNNSVFENRKPKWTRAVRAMVLLEHIGTPDARAIVDTMASGHPEAQPARVAKDLIAARKPGS